MRITQKKQENRKNEAVLNRDFPMLSRSFIIIKVQNKHNRGIIVRSAMKKFCIIHIIVCPSITNIIIMTKPPRDDFSEVLLLFLGHGNILELRFFPNHINKNIYSSQITLNISSLSIVTT